VSGSAGQNDPVLSALALTKEYPATWSVGIAALAWQISSSAPTSSGSLTLNQAEPVASSLRRGIFFSWRRSPIFVGELEGVLHKPPRCRLPGPDAIRVCPAGHIRHPVLVVWEPPFAAWRSDPQRLSHPVTPCSRCSSVS
jgi:hypothetical protein